MATKSEIEQTILRVAGNPVSGPIRAMAGEFAEAIVALDEDPADTPKPVKPTARAAASNSCGSWLSIRTSNAMPSMCFEALAPPTARL